LREHEFTTPHAQAVSQISKDVVEQRERVPEEEYVFAVSLLPPLYLKMEDFQSGRCWVRTSDLCRVKAARWFAGRF
jgi:hypothetical protein